MINNITELSHLFDCDSIQKIKSQYKDFDYYKVNNFKKIKNSNSNIYLKGNYFIISIDQYMWHFLSEHLTQYELLKKEILDLKLLIISNEQIYPIKEEMISLPNYLQLIKKFDYMKTVSFFSDICKIYFGDDIENTMVYNLQKSNISLENIYFIYDWKGLVPYRLFKVNNLEFPYYLTKKINKEGVRVNSHQAWSTLENKNSLWQKDGMILLRNRMRSFLNKDNSLPQKIYIDRTDANLKWGSHSIKKNQSINDKDHVPSRYYRREHLIREYFENIGYKSLSLGEYEYIEQLNYFYNATHIAGLCGSGLLNSYVSEKNTNLIEVYVNRSYEFSYSYLTEISPINVFSIDLRSPIHEEAPINEKSYNLLNKYKGARSI